MKIIEVAIGELHPYVNNPRLNDVAVKYVKESIEKFGFKVPIVIDKNNVIVCGHTRYEAAKLLKLETIPCIMADDLSDEQIKAFRLADNKVAEFSTWDEFKLNLELGQLNDMGFDMEPFGFFDESEEDESEEKQKEEKSIASMELNEFEHYDYIVFVFDNKNDFITACNEFNIQKVRGNGKKHGRIGIGRIVRGSKLAERLRLDAGSDKQGEGGKDANTERSAEVGDVRSPGIAEGAV